MKTFNYGKDELQALDLYQPKEWNGKTLVLIHGGGWWQGDKGKEKEVATGLATEGYQVAALNYRLATQAKNLFPTQNEDVEAAYTWLLKNVPDFKADNIAFIGGSTGGHLAAYLGLTKGRPFVSLSGLLDLKGFYENHKETIPKQLIIAPDLPSKKIDQAGANDSYYKWIIENLLASINDDSLEKASIFSKVTKKSGPGLLCNSMNELVPAYEHQKLAELLRQEQIPVETCLLSGSRHGEAYIDDIWPNLLNFLKRYI